MTEPLAHKKILLIVSGGIAAYKALELIRLFKKNGAHTKAILTKGGAQFITPLSVSSLTGEHTFTDLWSLKDETDMGHIRLTREVDLVIIAPASANIMAHMAQGMAIDLATTTLLASSAPVMIAPAMNYKMWEHPATQKNIRTLKEYGYSIIPPTKGDMACGEYGIGRMAEPAEILKTVSSFFLNHALKPLAGKHAIVTAGPTHEPIDPVRFLGNRSSGKQGYAIASALIDFGAKVTLISGPTLLHPPEGANMINIQTAQDMLEASENALPADIAICAAAVSDWRAKTPAKNKIKKSDKQMPPTLELTQNPDILKIIANHKSRPSLVIGFAAETENLETNAKAKLKSKNCDWIIANKVGPDENNEEKTFGTDENQIYLISKNKTQKWDKMKKTDIAHKLALDIVKYFEE